MIQLFTFCEGCRSLTLILPFALTSCLFRKDTYPNSPFICFLLLETYKPSLRHAQGNGLLLIQHSKLFHFYTSQLSTNKLIPNPMPTPPQYESP